MSQYVHMILFMLSFGDFWSHLKWSIYDDDDRPLVSSSSSLFLLTVDKRNL